ncbi:MAG: hypothetical protein OEW56_00755, partial [Gemmatimonadota bacterium]|nr:hypothetical protein [Gemmatimonadota bacterium]
GWDRGRTSGARNAKHLTLSGLRDGSGGDQAVLPGSSRLGRAPFSHYAFLPRAFEGRSYRAGCYSVARS